MNNGKLTALDVSLDTQLGLTLIILGLDVGWTQSGRRLDVHCWTCVGHGVNWTQVSFIPGFFYLDLDVGNNLRGASQILSDWTYVGYEFFAKTTWTQVGRTILRPGYVQVFPCGVAAQQRNNVWRLHCSLQSGLRGELCLECCCCLVSCAFCRRPEMETFGRRFG